VKWLKVTIGVRARLWRPLMIAFVASIDDRLVVVEHGHGEHPRFGFDARPFQAEAIAVEPDQLDQIQVARPQLEAVRRVTRRFFENRRLDVLGNPHVAVDVVAFNLMT